MTCRLLHSHNYLLKINNAGSGLNGNMDKCTVEDMDSMYNLHVRSTFVITKRALPYIEKAKGKPLKDSRREIAV